MNTSFNVMYYMQCGSVKQNSLLLDVTVISSNCLIFSLQTHQYEAVDM